MAKGHAINWIDRKTDQSARRSAILECQAHLDTLGWDVPHRVPGCPGATLQFADLLEERSIMGDLLDVMLEDIHSRIQLDPALSRRYEVINLNFLDEINASTAIGQPNHAKH